MKIFGRDPAMILAAVYAFVALSAQFVYPITIDQQGYLNAAMAAGMGLIVAWSVARDRLVPAIVGFVKAGLAVALAFKLRISPEGQAAIMAAVGTISALLVRQNVTASISAEGLPVPKMPLLTA